MPTTTSTPKSRRAPCSPCPGSPRSRCSCTAGWRTRRDCANSSGACTSADGSRCRCSGACDHFRVPSRVSAVRFVAWAGVVSALSDIVYEGGRSVIGPYLATFGASAAVVGVVTGIGEAVALVLRLVTGPFADRTGKPWPQTIVGYALTLVCVPLMGVAGGLTPAATPFKGGPVPKGDPHPRPRHEPPPPL